MQKYTLVLAMAVGLLVIIGIRETESVSITKSCIIDEIILEYSLVNEKVC